MVDRRIHSCGPWPASQPTTQLINQPTQTHHKHPPTTQRLVMAFKPAVAPIKAGVYPLLNKPEFSPYTEHIVQLLTEAGALPCRCVALRCVALRCVALRCVALRARRVALRCVRVALRCVRNTCCGDSVVALRCVRVACALHCVLNACCEDSVGRTDH